MAIVVKYGKFSHLGMEDLIYCNKTSPFWQKMSTFLSFAKKVKLFYLRSFIVYELFI